MCACICVYVCGGMCVVVCVWWYVCVLLWLCVCVCHLARPCSIGCVCGVWLCLCVGWFVCVCPLCVVCVGVVGRLRVRLFVCVRAKVGSPINPSNVPFVCPPNCSCV